jgi:hypothetical protein
MAPAGDPSGITPDVLADVIGADSIDDALERWAQACHLARGIGWEMDRGTLDDWQLAEEQRERDAELYGPQEYAELLGCSAAAFHQRRRRGQVAEPDLVLSKVPIWSGYTIRTFHEHEWDQA